MFTDVHSPLPGHLGQAFLQIDALSVVVGACIRQGSSCCSF
jgi:hypothetical protein